MSTLMSISRFLALRVSGPRVSVLRGHPILGVPDRDPDLAAADVAVDVVGVARFSGTSHRDRPNR
jgi:hypothetical protein